VRPYNWTEEPRGTAGRKKHRWSRGRLGNRAHEWGDLLSEGQRTEKGWAHVKKKLVRGGDPPGLKRCRTKTCTMMQVGQK